MDMILRPCVALLIPGAFLVVTLLCITNLGDYLRSRTSRKESNL